MSNGAEMTPEANTMWGVPYTGYATFLYRNLKVLKAAGIDPNEPVETWDQWLEQMKKVSEAGYIAFPSFYDDWWDFTNIYSGVSMDDEWGIDFESKATKITPKNTFKRLSSWKRQRNTGLTSPSGPGDHRPVPQR